MEIALLFFLLILGFGLVLKGADWLVEGASSVAKKFNVSELTIGLTVVAFGTSAPELAVNVQANSEIIFGNIIGSNAFNLLCILGIAGLIKPLTVKRTTIKYEIPIAFLVCVLLYFLVNDEWLFESANMLSQIDGVVLIGFFLIFLFYVFKTSKNEIIEEVGEIKVLPSKKAYLFLVLGIAGLAIGGNLVVDNASALAKLAGISDTMIGLTIVSFGTSLPELASSGMAAYKGKSDIAIGNILGSNIFNILLILGVSSIIGNQAYDIRLNVDSLVVIGATLFLLIALISKKSHKLGRVEAALLLIGFIAYMVFVSNRELNFL